MTPHTLNKAVCATTRGLLPRSIILTGTVSILMYLKKGFNTFCQNSLGPFSSNFSVSYQRAPSSHLFELPSTLDLFFLKTLLQLLNLSGVGYKAK